MIIVDVVHGAGDLTVLGLIGKLIGWIAGILGAYLVWRIRTKEAENKELKKVVYDTRNDLEKHKVEDELIKQSFENYKKYKEKEDDGFKNLLSGLGKKIDGLITKFGELKDDIHELDKKIVGIKTK